MSCPIAPSPTKPKRIQLSRQAGLVSSISLCGDTKDMDGPDKPGHNDAESC
jgi:hypothetical protein